MLALTCLLAYWVGTRRGLARAGLRGALASTLEVIGLFVVLFALNVTLALLWVLVTRALTGWFVSVYLVDDVTIPVVSLLQALVLRWWWERG